MSCENTEIVPLQRHRKGDTWLGITLELKDNDSNPIDLTGVKVLTQFRERKDSKADPVLELSTENAGIATINPTTGVITFLKRKIDLNPGTYYYDIQLTFLNGDVQTLFDSTWEIYSDVSRYAN
jgi:hypothetical protein